MQAKEETKDGKVDPAEFESEIKFFE